MGFTVGRKIYRMRFTDGWLEGAEIDVKAMTLGELRALQDFQSDKTLLERRDKELDEFLAYVIGWNLEDESGNALPVDQESIAMLPSQDATRILRTWYKRCLGTELEENLEKPSSDGVESLEESIPMTEVS